MDEKNLVEFGGGTFRRQSEDLHRLLYQFHSDVSWQGGSRIKDALRLLHEIEVGNADLRPVVRRYIIEFERLRDAVDELWKSAARLRTDLIRENGCDNSCELSKAKAA